MAVATKCLHQEASDCSKNLKTAKFQSSQGVMMNSPEDVACAK
jgi:hypothetical protein